MSNYIQTNAQATGRTTTLRGFWNKAHSDDIQRRCTRRGLWQELELYEPAGTDRSRSDPDTLEMPNKGCMYYMGDPTAIPTEELKVTITRATWGPRTPEPCHQWISPALMQLQHRPVIVRITNIRRHFWNKEESWKEHLTTLLIWPENTSTQKNTKPLDHNCKGFMKQAKEICIRFRNKLQKLAGVGLQLLERWWPWAGLKHTRLGGYPAGHKAFLLNKEKNTATTQTISSTRTF